MYYSSKYIILIYLKKILKYQSRTQVSKNHNQWMQPIKDKSGRLPIAPKFNNSGPPS